MRWLCTKCDVEWSTSGEDHGPCFECGTGDDVVETFEAPAWAWGYRP